MNDSVQATSTGLIDQVACNFMTLKVGIGTWRGVSMNKSAAARAAEREGVDIQGHGRDSAARLYVNMLGSSQTHLKQVQALYTKVRTYVYDMTQSTASGDGGRQKRGDLLIPTVAVADVYAKLTSLQADAEAELEKFLTQYDMFVERAKGELKNWATEGREYPSVDEVRAAFYIEVSPPRPLSPVNVAQLRNANIPTKLAEKLAAQSVAEVNTQLEAAKTNTLQAATEHLTKVATQLRTGKRLHQSLIDNTKVHGQFLAELAKALGDPRIETVAEKIINEVANVKTTEQWKNSYWKKADARKAAESAVKVLSQTAQASTSSLPPTSSQQAPVEDMLPDLL